MKSIIRLSIAILSVSLLTILASCDLRSETAMKGVEKYEPAPVPSVSPIPTPTPVAPADIAKVDTSLDGDTISITGYEQKKTVSCSKYDRVMVNGDDSVVKVTGVCRQIMINGDRNEITLDAAMEIVLNGSGNSVRYSRYANGKQPSIIDNQSGNLLEKIPAPAVTSGGPTRKIEK